MDSSLAAQLEALVLFLKHQRHVVDYTQISAFAALYYDFLLTIHLEIRLVWFSAWSYTKILFLSARYVVLVNCFFILHNQLFPNVKPATCQWSFKVATWLLMAGLVFAEIVLAIRTWAVWKRSRMVGLIMTVCVVGNIILNAIIISKDLNALEVGPAPYPEYRGCFVVGASNILYISFASLTAIHALFLGFMAASAFRAFRCGSNTKLSTVIHRDGVLFYVYLLCLAVINLVIILVLPADFENLLVPMQSSLYSMLTCRIILNIRSAGRKIPGDLATEDVFTDLHEIGNRAHRGQTGLSRLKFSTMQGEHEEIEMF